MLEETIDCPRQELNLKPFVYKTKALPIVLQGRVVNPRVTQTFVCLRPGRGGGA